MNPAALARYANPGAELGHAGPSAPVHADPRLDFVAAPRALADLPIVAEGIRATLLQRDAESLREQHRIMLDALRLIALGNDDSAAIARAAMVRASFE